MIEAQHGDQKQLIIRSGGQTGVDRGALDAAMAMGFPIAGWCPHGRLAEDGPIDDRYSLIETESSKYSIRTDWNVRDADATLIISRKPLEGGTRLTEEYAIKRRKPCFIFDLNHGKSADAIVEWLQNGQFLELNVAGPREAKHPGVYQLTFDLVTEILMAVGCMSS